MKVTITCANGPKSCLVNINTRFAINYATKIGLFYQYGSTHQKLRPDELGTNLDPRPERIDQNHIY
jgi:hypothetical protein